MAATIKIACPKCKKTFQAPPTVQGKKVKCKGCGEVFTAAPKEDEEWGAIKAYPVDSVKDAPRCPFCAHELEEEDQIVCLNCGYNLLTRERLEPRVLEPVTGGDQFMWLLPGILCLLGVLAAVGFGVCVWLPNTVLDWGLDWKEWVQDGEFIKVYLSVILLFAIFFLGRFAVKRLILHPHPPDKEKHLKSEGND
jgi:DNA-directed RNA polymerase subunit RPC12/RpoP